MNKSLLIELTAADGTTRMVTPMELEKTVAPPLEELAEYQESRLVLLLSNSWLWIGIGIATIITLMQP